MGLTPSLWLFPRYQLLFQTTSSGPLWDLDTRKNLPLTALSFAPEHFLHFSSMFGKDRKGLRTLLYSHSWFGTILWRLFRTIVPTTPSDSQAPWSFLPLALLVFLSSARKRDYSRQLSTKYYRKVRGVGADAPTSLSGKIV